MSEAAADSGPEQQYLAALAHGQFQIQHCAGCDKYIFYPRVLCPHCGGDKLSWARPSGLGTVYSYSIVRKKPAAGGERGGDYNVVLVDLQEGVRMMGRMEGIANEAIIIGMRVHIEIRQEHGQGVVVFVPNSGATL